MCGEVGSEWCDAAVLGGEVVHSVHGPCPLYDYAWPTHAVLNLSILAGLINLKSRCARSRQDQNILAEHVGETSDFCPDHYTVKQV